MVRPTIAVIDYGMGNLRSVAKALELVGAKAVVTDSPRILGTADGIVFPGVGSFGAAMDNLRKTRLKERLLDVIQLGKPFLGICLGFQLLFSSSEEDRKCRGLGVIPGKVVRFSRSTALLKVPHMGWNTVSFSDSSPAKRMFRGIPGHSYFYFVHSYYGNPDDRSVVSGSTEYGTTFCSAVASNRVWACQFHPEKSGRYGLKLLKNFVNEA
jgi:glutamine amidotransferase